MIRKIPLLLFLVVIKFSGQHTSQIYYQALNSVVLLTNEATINLGSAIPCLEEHVIALENYKKTPKGKLKIGDCLIEIKALHTKRVQSHLSVFTLKKKQHFLIDYIN